MLECTERCVKVGQDKISTCLGDVHAIRSYNRLSEWWASEQNPEITKAIHNKLESNQNRSSSSRIIFKNDGYSTEPKVHVVSGALTILKSRHNNINHAFHDDFWSVLVHHRRIDKANVTVAYYTDSQWLEGLIQAAAFTYHWRTLDIRSTVGPNNTIWICNDNDDNKPILMNGFLRNLYSDSVELLPKIRHELRETALDQVNEQLRTPVLYSNELKTKEKIVIYTRDDSQWRQLRDVEALVKLFDQDRYHVSVVDAMPESFLGQVQLFSSSSLFVAPNGGWAPNVLWMPDTACLVEAHLYETDSWIEMFGLKRLFLRGRFMIVTGDYSDPNAEKIVRSNRIGGDDQMFGYKLAPDVQRALETSHACRRFLKA